MAKGTPEPRAVPDRGKACQNEEAMNGIWLAPECDVEENRRIQQISCRNKRTTAHRYSLQTHVAPQNAGRSKVEQRWRQFYQDRQQNGSRNIEFRRQLVDPAERREYVCVERWVIHPRGTINLRHSKLSGLDQPFPVQVQIRDVSRIEEQYHPDNEIARRGD